MLIAQISDVHVGGVRYKQELLHAAIREINEAGPDIVVVAGDLTDDGYPDQYPQAKLELEALACDNVVLVPGNHDARNVGYVLFEDTFGSRDTRLRLESAGLQVQLVGVDTSKPEMLAGLLPTPVKTACVCAKVDGASTSRARVSRIAGIVFTVVME